MHAASVNPEPGSNSLKIRISNPEGLNIWFLDLFSSFFLLFEFLFQSVCTRFRTFQCSKFRVVQFSMSGARPRFHVLRSLVFRGLRNRTCILYTNFTALSRGFEKIFWCFFIFFSHHGKRDFEAIFPSVCPILGRICVGETRASLPLFFLFFLYTLCFPNFFSIFGRFAVWNFGIASKLFKTHLTKMKEGAIMD